MTLFWDSSSGYLDVSQLNLGDEIFIRTEFLIVPKFDKSLLKARYLLGSGAGEYPLQFLSTRLDDGAGVDYPQTQFFGIYMGDLNTKNNPIKIQVKLSESGVLVNKGFYLSIKSN